MANTSIRIALAGNPNSGKTTLFNSLTGSSQYVGNWPGVTVEKKEGKLKKNRDVIIQDLPGIYSLSPYTLEEVVTRNYLIGERPDAIINIVDATNLERNLYLTTQLLELGVPVIIALNLMDIVKKSGDTINVEKLSAALGCPVIETSALKGEGTLRVAEKALELARQRSASLPVHKFSKPVETAVAEIEKAILDKAPADKLRWYAIKLFERDEKVREQISLSGTIQTKIESAILLCEELEDDESESIITNERYTYITGIISGIVRKKNRGRTTTSDRIDRIVTNRVLGLPIFALIMFLVYSLSISTVGAWGTDWVNEVLFGELVPGAVGNLLESLGTADWLNSLILDGILAGVGAVLGFLPQMLILFLCLAVLEDCGYMARIAFVMDRIFRKFGLSGKSFIPILIGTGCGVPGIMASRTIENESDRKMTIIVTTFIPCSAKLPIIALIAGAMFGGSSLVAFSAYMLGIAAIVTSGVILKKTRGFAGEPSPFVMELPAYHIPGAKGVLTQTWERGKSFIKKAGTIIFLASALIWFLSTFNFSMQMVGTEASMLASLGRVIAPVFTPLGWGDWMAAVGAVSGLVAKENLVATFGILFAGLEEVAEDGAELWTLLPQYFTPLAAYSYLIFNLLCAPCFAAIGAIHREMGSVKWTLIAVGYQTALAYGVSLVVYNLGMLLTGGGFTVWTAVAIILAVLFLYLLLRRGWRREDISRDEREKARV